MKIAVGIKTHCGWAALVVVGRTRDEFILIDRRRIELVQPGEETWAKQPYHAAEGLPADAARQLVERGLEAARRVATSEMRALTERTSNDGQAIVGCALLVPAPMPGWTTEQILSVHMRMHKAEGALFSTAIALAATSCKMNLLAIHESEMNARVEDSLAIPLATALGQVATLGRSAGAPWGKDQKISALAAMIALSAVR